MIINIMAITVLIIVNVLDYNRVFILLLLDKIKALKIIFVTV